MLPAHGDEGILITAELLMESAESHPHLEAQHAESASGHESCIEDGGEHRVGAEFKIFNSPWQRSSKGSEKECQVVEDVMPD